MTWKSTFTVLSDNPVLCKAEKAKAKAAVSASRGAAGRGDGGPAGQTPVVLQQPATPDYVQAVPDCSREAVGAGLMVAPPESAAGPKEAPAAERLDGAARRGRGGGGGGGQTPVVLQQPATPDYVQAVPDCSREAVGAGLMVAPPESAAGPKEAPAAERLDGAARRGRGGGGRSDAGSPPTAGNT